MKDQSCVKPSVKYWLRTTPYIGCPLSTSTPRSTVDVHHKTGYDVECSKITEQYFADSFGDQSIASYWLTTDESETLPKVYNLETHIDKLECYPTSQETVKSLNRNEEQTRRNSVKRMYKKIGTTRETKILRKPNILNRKISPRMKSKTPQSTETRKISKKLFKVFRNIKKTYICRRRSSRKQDISNLRCVSELKPQGDKGLKADIFSLNYLFRDIMTFEKNGKNGKLNINVLPPNETIAGTFNIVLSHQEKNTQSECKPSPSKKLFGNLQSMKTTESCNVFEYSSLLNTWHNKRKNPHEEDTSKLTNKLVKANDQDDDEEERGRESRIEVTNNKTEEEEEEEEEGDDDDDDDDDDEDEEDSDYEEESSQFTDELLTEFDSVLQSHMNGSRQKLPPSNQGQCLSNISLNTAINIRKSQEDEINNSNSTNDDNKNSVIKESFVEDKKVDVPLSTDMKTKILNDIVQTTAVPMKNLIDKTSVVLDEPLNQTPDSMEDSRDTSLNSLLKDMCNEYRNDLDNSGSSSGVSSSSGRYSSSPRNKSLELYNDSCLTSSDDSGFENCTESFSNTKICDEILGTNTQTTNSCEIMKQTNVHTTSEDEESIPKSLPHMNNHDTGTKREDSKLGYQRYTSGEVCNKTEYEHTSQKLLCTSSKIDECISATTEADKNVFKTICVNITPPQLQISMRNSQKKDLKIKNSYEKTECPLIPKNVSQKKPSDVKNCSFQQESIAQNISPITGQHNLTDKMRSSEVEESIQQKKICLPVQKNDNFLDSGETNQQSRSPLQNCLLIEKRSETDKPVQQIRKQSCVAYKENTLSGNEPDQKRKSSVSKQENVIIEMNSPRTKDSFQKNEYATSKQTNSVYEQKALEIQRSNQGNISPELPQISLEETKTSIFQNSAQDKNLMKKIPCTNTSKSFVYPGEYACVFTDLQENTETFIAGDIGTQEEVVYMTEDEKCPKVSRKRKRVNQDLSFTLQCPIMTRSRSKALKKLEEEIFKESLSINKAKQSLNIQNESEEFQNVDRMSVFPVEQITNSRTEENPKTHNKNRKERKTTRKPTTKAKEKKSGVRGKGGNIKLDSVMTHKEMESKKQSSNSMAEFDVEEEQITVNLRRPTKQRTPWAGRTRSSSPLTFRGYQKKTDKSLVCDEIAQTSHTQTKSTKKQTENDVKHITAKKQRNKDLKSNERKLNLDQIENDWESNVELETTKQNTVEKEFVSVISKSFELPVAENQMKGNHDLKRNQHINNYDEEINVVDDMKEEAKDPLSGTDIEPYGGPNDKILELDSHYQNDNMLTSVKNDLMNGFPYTTDQTEELINPTFMSWSTDKREVVLYQKDDPPPRRASTRRQSVSRCRGTGRAKPEKPFVCTICGDRHQYEAVLEDHYRMYHNLSFSN